MHSFEIQINVCKQFCINCLSCTHYPVSLFDRRKRKYSMTSTRICIILDKKISWICLAATNTLPFDKNLHHFRYQDFMNICVASQSSASFSLESFWNTQNETLASDVISFVIQSFSFSSRWSTWPNPRKRVGLASTSLDSR